MQLKFTFIDPDNNSFVASDPSGWAEATINLDRHSDFHSLIENITSSFMLYGKNATLDGARDWMLVRESTYGVDGLIQYLVEIDFDDDGSYDVLKKGNLAVGLFIESLDTDHFLQVVFAPETYWGKFVARLDQKVNPQSRGDEDGNTVAPINYKAIPLPSQKIIKTYKGYQKNNAVFQIIDLQNIVFQIGFDIENLKEIEEQSAIKLSLIYGSDKTYTGIAPPQYYDKIVPFFNPIDDGEFVIDNLRFTMSQGPTNDPNFSTVHDWVRAKNGKFTAMTNVDFYIMVNDVVTPLQKTHRSIPTSYLRNDGVTEQLYVDTNSPQVTDFYLASGTILTIKKYDAVKLFGIYNDIPDLPYPKIRNGLVWLWGTDGWSHDSGYDQMRGGQGNYMKLRSGASSPLDDSNQGNFAYGGDALTGVTLSGKFPTQIIDDGNSGLPQSIKASQWWTVGTPIRVVGGTILLNAGQVIQAKVDNPTDSLADWNVGNLTPYEGLEAYASKETSFQGYYDPSITNDLPANETVPHGGSNTIKWLDRWYITSLLTNLGGAYVDSTYIIQALKDSPTLRAHWWISTREYYDSYWLQGRQLQGNWDASIDSYPPTRFDTSAIKADDIWIISVGGIFGGVGGVPVGVGFVIRACVDSPAQVNANWDVFTFDDWVVYAIANIKYYSGMQITFNTTYQDTIGQGFLVHDIAAGIIDRISGQSGLLNAPFLGNPYTSKPYVSAGCASLLAVFKGLQVRGYDLVEKPFFVSFKEFWDGLNPIYPLGLGYDVDGDGNPIIVIDDRANFFDPTMSIKLDWVQNIKRNHDNDQQYNSVEIGYQKWQSQAVSGIGTPTGIDDPQTIQTRNTIFKNIGHKISILSKFIAASLTFETTRRVTNKQSANYTYDNETFIVDLKSNGDGTFQPNTPSVTNDFSEIDNLTNSDSRYNTRLSTTRNFLRNLKYVSGALQDYLTSFFRFASGEGNYRMSSKITTSWGGDETNVLVTENDDIQVSNDPIHRAELFTISDHDLTWSEYKTIRDNRGQAIGISQTDSDHVPFFIKTLKFNLAQGTVTLEAWPKSKFTIRVIDTVPQSARSSRRHESKFERRYD